MSDEITLYGVNVPAREYTALKKLADVAFGYSLSSTPEKLARKWAVHLAQRWKRQAEYEAKLSNKALTILIKPDRE